MGIRGVPQRFIFNPGAVIAFQAIVLFGGLIIHIRRYSSGYSATNVFLGALVTLAFVLLFLCILNASRTADVFEFGVLSLLIITAQTVAVTIQFSMRSTSRYCCVTSLLALVITVYAIGGAYLFHIGGGF